MVPSLLDLVVAVDTGSSDLWVHTNAPLKTTKRTDIEIKLSYGIGSAAGNVVYGPTCLGDYCIAEQGQC